MTRSKGFAVSWSIILGLVMLVGAMSWSLRGDYFAASPTQVRAALKSSKIGTSWLGEDHHLSVAESGDDIVITRFINDEGQTSLTITSQLNLGFNGTRVLSDYALNSEALSSQDAEALSTADSNVIERYGREHIASNIEGRPFDILALSRGWSLLKFFAAFAPKPDHQDHSLDPQFKPIPVERNSNESEWDAP